MMAEEEKHRVEAFSDGVFAIAITLLILEIRLPPGEKFPTNIALLSAIGAIWPSFLAFILSFVVVLMIWINHRELFRLVRGVDHKLMWANGSLLLMVIFVPFPTGVLAQYFPTEAANTAVALYCGTLFLTSVCHNLLFESVAYKSRLLKSDVRTGFVSKLRKSYRFGLAIYAVATLVAIFNAIAGLVLVTSLWLLWIPVHRRMRSVEKMTAHPGK
jgi:uncharacterized membrane protein